MKRATATGLVIAASLLAACGSQGRHTIMLRYTPQQPLCSAAEAGWHATVIGPGTHRFGAVCDPLGNGLYVWDARP